MAAFKIDYDLIDLDDDDEHAKIPNEISLVPTDLEPARITPLKSPQSDDINHEKLNAADNNVTSINSRETTDLTLGRNKEFPLCKDSNLDGIDNCEISNKSHVTTKPVRTFMTAKQDYTFSYFDDLDTVELLQPAKSTTSKSQDHTYALNDGPKTSPVKSSFVPERSEPSTSYFQQEKYKYEGKNKDEPWNDGPSTSYSQKYKYEFKENLKKPRIENFDTKEGLLQIIDAEIKNEVKPELIVPKTEPYSEPEPASLYAEKMPIEYKVLKKSGYKENAIEEYLKKFYDTNITLKTECD